ncbi:hypothetical protein [Candidatus Kuenenia sp.]|uniref:hypothetical protein n=1 Tax=Candidatus Kuenenia sp. TaxID=2499824 RepID=UPI00322032EA
MKLLTIVTFLILLICSASVVAEEATFGREDRDRLIRLEVLMHEFKDSVDKRFEQIDKRFESSRDDMNQRFESLRGDMNQRFESLRDDMNQRFEQVDKRFEQMFGFLWIITGIFTSLTLGVIGFAYWDRRTIIKKAKEETIAEIEKQGLSANLLQVLRELAKEDSKLANVLRQFHLL